MINDDVAIKTLFRLDVPDPGKVIEIYDEIDYVGAGDDIGDFVGVLDISGPQGTIYENTDFGNPDIVPATSRKIIPLVYLILDPAADYWPMKGTYTIKYTVQNTSTLDEYFKTFVYSFQFDKPAMGIDVDSGPYTANLRSTDLTDYGTDILTLTREHRLVLPPLAPGGPYPDVVSTLAFIQVTTTYTNVWVCSVKTTVEYQQAVDDLFYTWYGEVETKHCVYGSCLDSMYSALDTMYGEYLRYLGVNKVQSDLYMERLIRVNSAELLLEIAWRGNDYEEADKQAAVIHEVIEISGIQGCDPSGISALVVVCPPWGGGGTPPAYTFSNGLTEITGAVKLGGSLTEDTVITIEAHDLTLTGVSGGKSAQFFMDPKNAIVQIDAADTSTGSRIVSDKDKVTLAYLDIGTPANNLLYYVGSTGLVEAADYSAGYGNFSLVNKLYVDANNDWGSQVVNTDATITGDGTAGDPLVVVDTFPGFADLFTDYGYTEPTHAFSEITSPPTTIAGYGITDAVGDFTDLGDVPSDYTGHGGKFVMVTGAADGLEFSAASGWVPSTGGSFTGVVTHKVNTNYLLIVQRDGAAGTPGIADASINRIQFQDSDGDAQGYIGIDGSGNISLNTLISGGKIYAEDTLTVTGDIEVTGLVDAVDIAAFKAAYDNHIAAANPHGTNMEDLSDVPAYSGNSLKIPRINVGETAIEWVDPASTADRTYLHVQGAASSTWNINHDLDKYPSVLIMDDSGNVIQADGIQHTDLNNTIITFTSDVDGQAAFN